MIDLFFSLLAVSASLTPFDLTATSLRQRLLNVCGSIEQRVIDASNDSKHVNVLRTYILNTIHNTAIYRYHQLCKNTYFVTGVGNKKRVIPLEPVALGAAKVEALPGFHAVSGADVTGRFAGKGKLTGWQALSRCSM